MGTMSLSLNIWDIPTEQLQEFIDLLDNMLEQLRAEKVGIHFDRSHVTYTETE